MSGKYNFSYERFVNLLKNNEKNLGDDSGDGGQSLDALILLYFLLQKYGSTDLSKVIDEMKKISSKGLDNIFSQIVIKHLWDY